MPADTPARNAALARKLTALSLDPATRAVTAERVRAVLATVSATRAPAAARHLLKAYRTALAREIALTEARIEHAGPLPPELETLLAAHFSRLTQRPITPVTKPNPALLAGLRVRIGDNVHDASALGTLQRQRQ